MLLALALACASPERAYLDALSGAGACEAVGDPALRGECLSFAARDLAEAGQIDAAIERCRAASELWQDECVFLVSDTAEATFELADRLCNQARALRPQCLGHASNREARALLSTPGGEQAALDRLYLRVRAFRGEAMARDEARRLVVQRVAGRGPDAPFDRAICGDLPDGLCRDVYIERLIRAGGRDPKDGCADPSLRPILGPFAPESASLAGSAWEALCAGAQRQP